MDQLPKVDDSRASPPGSGALPAAPSAPDPEGSGPAAAPLPSALASSLSSSSLQETPKTTELMGDVPPAKDGDCFDQARALMMLSNLATSLPAVVTTSTAAAAPRTRPVACVMCRTKKVKCNIARGESCPRCNRLGIPCEDPRAGADGYKDKFACTVCRTKKVRCKVAAASSKCERCSRSGLVCEYPQRAVPAAEASARPKKRQHAETIGSGKEVLVRSSCDYMRCPLEYRLSIAMFHLSPKKIYPLPVEFFRERLMLLRRKGDSAQLVKTLALASSCGFTFEDISAYPPEFDYQTSLPEDPEVHSGFARFTGLVEAASVRDDVKWALEPVGDGVEDALVMIREIENGELTVCMNAAMARRCAPMHELFGENIHIMTAAMVQIWAELEEDRKANDLPQLMRAHPASPLVRSVYKDRPGHINMLLKPMDGSGDHSWLPCFLSMQLVLIEGPSVQTSIMVMRFTPLSALSAKKRTTGLECPVGACISSNSSASESGTSSQTSDVHMLESIADFDWWKDINDVFIDGDFESSFDKVQWQIRA